MLEERKVAIDELTLGMYVSRLDRPWGETPFPLQGFSVESLPDIELLRRYSRFVFVDVHKTLERSRSGLLPRLGYGALRAGRPPLAAPTRHPDSVPLRQELPHAQVAWDELREVSNRFIADIRAGKRLSHEALGAAIEPIVASVIRNADAFFWLQAVRQRDPYAYSHALNCCALAATFGRHLGLPRPVLIDIASGGMLMDVGMAMLPEALCHHPEPLTVEAQAAMRTHVDLSVDQLESMGIINLDVRDMILRHHERHDGSGYPDGLKGNEIPLMGRLLGLVDTYDAMSSVRPHRACLSRHAVLQALYHERDRLFQAELVEQFSQCIGVYPTGSLVELSSGEVAVVTEQNAARRLLPRVIVLTRPDKSLDPAFRQINLMAAAQRATEAPRLIVRALPRGAYGLDLPALFLNFDGISA